MKTSEISPNCPYCASKNTCKVYWGFPNDKKWHLKELEWKCADCSKKWGHRDDFHE